MWQYNYENELYHYGIPGMKWGHRKALKYEAKANKLRKSAKQWDRAAKSYKKELGATDDATLRSEQYAYKEKRKAKKYEQKAKEARKMIEQRMQEKEANQKYKDAIKKRAKEINKGASFVGKIFNNVTNAHVNQAKIEYDIEKRSKVNKAWRD